MMKAQVPPGMIATWAALFMFFWIRRHYLSGSQLSAPAQTAPAPAPLLLQPPRNLAYSFSRLTSEELGPIKVRIRLAGTQLYLYVNTRSLKCRHFFVRGWPIMAAPYRNSPEFHFIWTPAVADAANALAAVEAGVAAGVASSGELPAPEHGSAQQAASLTAAGVATSPPPEDASARSSRGVLPPPPPLALRRDDPTNIVRLLNCANGGKWVFMLHSDNRHRRWCVHDTGGSPGSWERLRVVPVVGRGGSADTTCVIRLVDVNNKDTRQEYYVCQRTEPDSGFIDDVSLGAANIPQQLASSSHPPASSATVSHSNQKGSSPGNASGAGSAAIPTVPVTLPSSPPPKPIAPPAAQPSTLSLVSSGGAEGVSAGSLASSLSQPDLLRHPSSAYATDDSGGESDLPATKRPDHHASNEGILFGVTTKTRGKRTEFIVEKIPG
eukprot:TRINITY_DN6930_c0_g1_i1.p1 TRINITY_DN6930_c0_g1~~TRINITY_DN6930_c0_g1_i1.p1  ORF type:complete len:501 (+),score=85.47 TRINITY_DN6930_c0_g1_i1:190-1503(+)